MGPAGSLAFVRPLLRARDWQDRPQFAEVCEWWRNGGIGVCSLIGIGGAGKTATADRFLQVLPGAYAEHPQVPKDPSLSPAERLLVFSFYDAPNPDMFFEDVSRWLTGESHLSYEQIVTALPGEGRRLLVLDGLERVQDDGTRGGNFGQIADARLRNLVLSVSSAWWPRVSLLVTSRFRLFDPEFERKLYHQHVDIDRLEHPAAIHLLRDRGVQGTDGQLERVVSELGAHALSVDLAGGYIARFCGRQATQWVTFEHEDVSEDAKLDPKLAADLAQERTFAKLATRYHDTLATHDPAALALLQRICIHRIGVSVKTLTATLLGPQNLKVAGLALSRLLPKQLYWKLRLLSEMRLVEPARADPSMYTIHPAVRAGFLSRLSPEAARQGHEAVREALGGSLRGDPGQHPTDNRTLDALEEIMYHTLAAGHGEMAWDIYWTRIGAYPNLGHRLAAFDRGQRICRMFAGGRPPEDAPLPDALPPKWHAVFLNGWALYLEKLGELRAASRCIERAAECDCDYDNYRSIELRNLSSVLTARGLLEEALDAAIEAESLVVLDRAESASATVYRTNVEILRGDLEEASRAFATPEWGRRGIDTVMGAQYFLRMRRPKDAILSAKATNTPGLQGAALGHLWTGECSLLFAEAAHQQDDIDQAREYLQTAYEWALQRDSKGLLCWSARVRARLELDAGDLDAAGAVIEDGLRIAREYGYALRHIDLLLLRAELALRDGRAEDALDDIRVAIHDGVHPHEQSGFPELPAARDPRCGYVWAIADGHQLMGEALALQAAQRPGEATTLKERVREELQAALECWKDLRDPTTRQTHHPNARRTWDALALLDSGRITNYPVSRTVLPQPAVTAKPVGSRRAVFISYAHADDVSPKKWLQRLLLHLKPFVRQEDLVIWSDRQLKLGDAWRGEIRRQLEQAGAAVLLVSPAYLASEFIASEEIPVLLRRAHVDGLTIIPVLVAPSAVQRTRFGPEEFTLMEFKAVGSPSRTLADMSDVERERALVELAERIQEIRSANS